MKVEKLVSMANQIGDFFESIPSKDEAEEGIVNHISKFWEPRMREALINDLNAPSTKELHPLVRHAIESNLTQLARKKLT